MGSAKAETRPSTSVGMVSLSNRINTGFSTFGRIVGRPREHGFDFAHHKEKGRSGEPFWTAKRGEKGGAVRMTPEAHKGLGRGKGRE